MVSIKAEPHAKHSVRTEVSSGAGVHYTGSWLPPLLTLPSPPGLEVPVIVAAVSVRRAAAARL